MMALDRRIFCFRSAAAFAVASSSSFGYGEAAAAAGVSSAAVKAFDRARVVRQADGYLAAEPVTVTASHSPRSAGGTHDFYSEGDYWWPDPKNPGGPYIRRDGFTNPENFVAHRDALLRFSQIVPSLAAAWVLTKKKVYAERAAAHLRAWFITPATRMNPNLEYAQAISGVNKGRGIGIIDTIQFVEPVRAMSLLFAAGVFSPEEQATLQKWFVDYLVWLTTSKNGQEERDQKNNHGSCWVMQVAEFSRFTGDAKLMAFCSDRFRSALVPNQVAANGSLPLELVRTKPYSYSIFDLDVLTAIAQILTSKEQNLFTFETPDGRGLRKAVAFMAPFLRDKKLWPSKPDVEYFDDLPARSPSLVFAALAYDDAQYLAIWKSLNAEPKVQEIIRNYPIRQPVLWV
jgi:hypothetical protein